ncbi:MAG TPA: hypothetical protein V6D27_03310 [Vampirovibrionales bacterium]
MNLIKINDTIPTSGDDTSDRLNLSIGHTIKVFPRSTVINLH